MLEKMLNCLFISQLFLIIIATYSEEQINFRDDSKQKNVDVDSQESLNFEDNDTKEKLHFEDNTEEKLSYEGSTEEKLDLEDVTQEKLNYDKQQWNFNTYSHENDLSEVLLKKIQKKTTQETGFDLTNEEIQKFKIWKHGVIPYYIDVLSYNDKVVRDNIRSFLRKVNTATSLNFVELLKPPTDHDTRWVFFINRRGLLGCADHSVKDFTNSGVQQVVLGYDCMAKGELAEAVMSIAGVPAQHNAPDRDKYIRVVTENIIPDKIHMFDKLRDDQWLFHDLQYDHSSVTHYDINKYSANGHATIVPLKDSSDINPATFSPTDILKIKMLYNLISRKNRLDVPGCKKLFERGRNFNKYASNSKMLVKPLPKPRQYLGYILSDTDIGTTDVVTVAKEQKEEDYDDDVTEEQENSENTEDIVSERGLPIGYRKPKITTKTRAWQVTKRVIPVSKLKTQIKSHLKGSILKNTTPDPLEALSDYETSDELNRKRILHQIQQNTISQLGKRHQSEQNGAKK